MGEGARSVVAASTLPHDRPVLGGRTDEAGAGIGTGLQRLEHRVSIAPRLDSQELVDRLATDVAELTRRLTG